MLDLGAQPHVESGPIWEALGLFQGCGTPVLQHPVLTSQNGPNLQCGLVGDHWLCPGPVGNPSERLALFVRRPLQAPQCSLPIPSRWTDQLPAFRGVRRGSDRIHAGALKGCPSQDPWNGHPPSDPTRSRREAMAGEPLLLEMITLEDFRARTEAVWKVFWPKEPGTAQPDGEPFLFTYRHQRATPLGGGRGRLRFSPLLSTIGAKLDWLTKEQEVKVPGRLALG